MDIKQAAKVLKALSHPKRLEIYLSIVKGEKSDFARGEGECCISDMMATLNIGAPTVSHHLKELTNAGLIMTERHGKFLMAKPILETWEEVKSILPG